MERNNVVSFFLLRKIAEKGELGKERKKKHKRSQEQSSILIFALLKYACYSAPRLRVILEVQTDWPHSLHPSCITKSREIITLSIISLDARYHRHVTCLSNLVVAHNRHRQTADTHTDL